jgi:hypothetical protein
MWKNDFVRGEREHIKYRRRLGDEGTPTYEAKAINPTYSGVGVRWKCNVLGFTVVHPNLRMMNCAESIVWRAVGWGNEGTPTYEAKAINPTYSGVGVTVEMQCVGVHGCSPQPTDDELEQLGGRCALSAG